MSNYARISCNYVWVEKSHFFNERNRNEKTTTTNDETFCALAGIKNGADTFQTLTKEKQMILLPLELMCVYEFLFGFLFMPVIHGACVRIRFLYGYDFLSIFFDASHCEGSHQRSWEKRVSLLSFFFSVSFTVHFFVRCSVRCERMKRKKRIAHWKITKMYRMISQAWTCNLMDFSFFV